MKTAYFALPCPFCGNEIDLNDSDTLHITGAWKSVNTHFRAYLSPQDPTADGYVYGIHCPQTYGGCGASINDDSVSEVVKAWNTRAKE